MNFFKTNDQKNMKKRKVENLTATAAVILYLISCQSPVNKGWY